MTTRKLRYIGDGAFIEGVPADDVEVEAAQAKALIASGIYEPYEETRDEKKGRAAAEKAAKASKAAANAAAAAKAADDRKAADEAAKAAEEAAAQTAAEAQATIDHAERTVKEAKDA